jgi:hypothetical protein
MALSDLIRKKSDPLADAIARLEADLQAAQDRLGEADKKWQDAIASDADAGEVDRLYSALEQAQRDRDRAWASLATAKERLKAAQAATEAKAEGDAWDSAVQLAERRVKLAEHFTRDSKAAAQSRRALLECNHELLAALTGKLNPLDLAGTGAVLGDTQLDDKMRQQMTRDGFDWASNHPWGIEALPVLVDVLQDTVTMIRQLRDAAAARRK